MLTASRTASARYAAREEPGAGSHHTKHGTSCSTDAVYRRSSAAGSTRGVHSVAELTAKAPRPLPPARARNSLAAVRGTAAVVMLPEAAVVLP